MWQQYLSRRQTIPITKPKRKGRCSWLLWKWKDDTTNRNSNLLWQNFFWMHTKIWFLLGVAFPSFISCCCCRFPVNVLSSNKHKPFELISREKRISTWHKVREEWLRLSVCLDPTIISSWLPIPTKKKTNVCHLLQLGVGSGVLVPWFCSHLCFFHRLYSSRCSDCCVATQHHFLPPPVCMIIEEIIDGALDMWHTSHRGKCIRQWFKNRKRERKLWSIFVDLSEIEIGLWL